MKLTSRHHHHSLVLDDILDVLDEIPDGNLRTAVIVRKHAMVVLVHRSNHQCQFCLQIRLPWRNLFQYY